MSFLADTDEKASQSPETDESNRSSVSGDYYYLEDDYGQDVDELGPKFVYEEGLDEIEPEPISEDTRKEPKFNFAEIPVMLAVAGIGIIILNELGKRSLDYRGWRGGSGNVSHRPDDVLEEVIKRDAAGTRDTVITTPAEFYDQNYGENYTQKARQIAEEYRRQNPHIPFLQNLDRLDTEAPIHLNRDEFFQGLAKGYAGMAMPAAGTPWVVMPTSSRFYRDPSSTRYREDIRGTLSHELVHTTQIGNNPITTGPLGTILRPLQYLGRHTEHTKGLYNLRQALIGAFSVDWQRDPDLSPAFKATYATNPYEIEAFASGLKRLDYKKTGVLPRTREEAEERIRRVVWAERGTPEWELARSREIGRTLYDRLRLMPRRERDAAIKFISTIYPGLVKSKQKKEIEGPAFNRLISAFSSQVLS